MEDIAHSQPGNNLQKKLASGLFWMLLLNLIIKPVWILGIDVGVQNAVGAEAYGFYFAIFNLAYIFNILLDVGITNYNTRNIARSPQLIRKYLSGILTVKLLLLGLYAVVTFTVGLLLGYTSEQFYLLAILTFNQFLNSLILYLRSNFEGLMLFRWDSVISILDRLLMILICGAMLSQRLSLLSTPFTIFHFAYAQTVAYLATAALALAVLLRRTGVRKLHFSRLFSLAILKQSLPYALLLLLMASYNRIDPLLLQQLLPAGVADTAVGVYASAFRLLDALTMIAYLVSVPLLPVFSRLTKDDDGRTEVAYTTRWVFALMMVYAVAAAVTLACLAEPLMQLLYRQHTDASAQVFRLLVYGIIPIGTTYVFGTLLTAAGRLKVLNLLAVSSLIINIGVNILLIPRYGAVGSAYASLAAQGFMALTQVVAAVRIFRLRISFVYILKLSLYTLLVVGVNLLAAPLPWGWHLAVAVVAAMGAAMALRLVDARQMMTLIKKE